MAPAFFNADETARTKGAPPCELAGAFFFGCGGMGKLLLGYFRERGIPAGGFVDNNPDRWGTSVEGAGVISPEEFVATRNDAALILSVGAGMEEVRRQCRELGARRAVPYYDCLRQLRILPFEVQMTAAEVEAHPGALGGLDLWADAVSREKYVRLIRFFVNPGADDELPREDGQYFSPRYMPAGHLRSFADVGAYRGDTWEAFLRATGGDFDAYHGMEPDPENFLALRRATGTGDERIHLYETAVGDAEGEVGFRSTGGIDAHVVAAGEGGSVRMDTLDGILGTERVTLIKMDVEGFEPGALRGAERLIRRERPALAISVYHRIDHLWEIPGWIHGLGLGYALRLGCHSFHNFDAICYAVPT